MSAGHRTIEGRKRTRRRAIGAGIAGVAAAFAVAPLAHAATPSATPTPSSAGGAEAPAPKAPAAGSTTVTTTTVTPNYGYQKIRVGVQEKDGTYPPNQDTSGTEITIVEDGPNASEGSHSTTCLTDASTAEAGSTATYCVFPRIANARHRSSADALDPINDPQDYYDARPGDTVTITQTSLGPNDKKVLLIDPSTKTYGPCTLGDGPLSEFDVCDDTPAALFNDPGIPPVANDDSATTPENTAVTVKVLSNDDTVVGAPVTGLVVTSDPSHGSVTKTATADLAGAAPTGPSFVYTPKSGFSGTDHFTYQLTDANGSDTAVVTITVNPAAVTSSASAAPTSATPTPSLSLSATVASSSSSSSSTPPPLAETGSPDLSLIELGGLLVAAGGAAIVVGRRRRRPGRHAD